MGELSWIKDLKYYKENDGKNSRYMNYQKSMTPYYKKSIGSKLSIYKIDDCGHLMGGDKPSVVSIIFRTIAIRKTKNTEAFKK